LSVVLSVEEIADLQERISMLEQEKDSEKASYEQQLEQLRTECKDAKDQLIADNLMKGQCHGLQFSTKFVNFACSKLTYFSILQCPV